MKAKIRVWRFEVNGVYTECVDKNSLQGSTIFAVIARSLIGVELLAFMKEFQDKDSFEITIDEYFVKLNYKDYEEITND